MQLEINERFRNYNDLENIKKICDSLISFINQYDEVLSEWFNIKKTMLNVIKKQNTQIVLLKMDS